MDDLEEMKAAVAATISASDVVLEEIVAKRKRYESDEPMRVWRPLSTLFLNELARRDGLGAATHCSCGEGLFCEQCVQDQHARRPLHMLEVWEGSFWNEIALHHRDVNSAGVQGLGALYQLGHDGRVCPCPGSRRTMVVIGVEGIVNVDVQYCDCRNTNGTDLVEQLLRAGWYPATTEQPSTCATFEALELFRLLRAIGNTNIQSFIRTLQRLRDPTRTIETIDREKEFGRMARQFDFLKRLRRAGRAHEPDGIALTKPGALAVLCWACPEEGRNLPEGWRDVEKDKQYLYQLFLSKDANFRLKNRFRPNERDDPSLGSGLGYFVELGPYKTHLGFYVSEKDISSCVAFQAMKQRDTRLSRGLRVTGVGGVVCARHGLVRRRGLGDLQKGERFANMDWILLCTLWMERLLKYGFAYDIACQWMVHFFERLEVIKARGGHGAMLATELEEHMCQFGLPVWHAAYLLGFGKTDGEAMERVWALLNPAAWATKEMGEGARHDVLEDKIDHLNWEKNIGLGLEFAELDKSIKKKMRRNWRNIYDAWVKDSTQQNPFVVEGGREAGPSEQAIAEDLKKTELEDMRAGRTPLFEEKMSVTAFIRAGLQLEETQRRIRAALKSKTLTATRGSEIQEMRVSLLKQMQTFERLQLTYMPGIESLREADEAARKPDQEPPKPENLKLYLPSSLTVEERAFAFIDRVAGAASCEAAPAMVPRRQLGGPEVLDSLEQRSRAGLDEVVERIVAKYRAAQAAVVELKGGDFAPQFRMLADADINLRVEEPEKDIAASKRLRGADGSRATRREPKPKKAGEKKKQKPIFCPRRMVKSTRKTHWEEEVELVREEMKRVIRSLRYAEEEWQGRADLVRLDVAVEVGEGLRAYALRQVAIHKRIAAGFYADWEKTRDSTWAHTEDMEFFISVMDGTERADEEANNASSREETSGDDEDEDEDV
ncbi:CxC2 domain-containing protein [Mycena chlorophos]|uniref:CxC2 domain-containing protein n=1 Tax=Mycena chlorophos TaxID=658473 RepID=A0A8H6SXJ6_MYCCL|nr:CxC2 domain-containing protein [Mycena chlorophos]